MILLQNLVRMRQLGRNFTIAAFALALAACAPTEQNEAIGSRLAQPPAGIPPQKPVDAGDIAIVGQEVAHSIMALPAVADASVPPMVKFTNVTSIIDKPIDTEPYTQLLRDRLILLTREKLRFVERTLPPLGVSKKNKKAPPETVENTTEPDYHIRAELRGHAEDEFYKIQIQFVDIRTSEVLFDGLYRIRKEASDLPPPAPYGNNQASPDTATPVHNLAAPTIKAPAATGNESL
jgi:PBP1b-binding outer membrane lipoprotein LpoB